MQKLNFEKLCEFHKKWLKNVFLTWFIAGNITSKSALGFIEESEARFFAERTPLPKVKSLSILAQTSIFNSFYIFILPFFPFECLSSLSSPGPNWNSSISEYQEQEHHWFRMGARLIGSWIELIHQFHLLIWEQFH